MKSHAQSFIEIARLAFVGLMLIVGITAHASPYWDLKRAYERQIRDGNRSIGNTRAPQQTRRKPPDTNEKEMPAFPSTAGVTLPPPGQQPPAEADTYDGERRFPVRPLELKPKQDKVPLMTENYYSPVGELEKAGLPRDMVCNEKGQCKKAEVTTGLSYSMRCEYGPLPSGERSWSLHFWYQNRPEIPDETVAKINSRDPWIYPTLVDVLIPKCPKTYGQAIAIANGQQNAEDIEKGYEQARNEAKIGGLRFSAPLAQSPYIADGSIKLVEGANVSLETFKGVWRERDKFITDFGNPNIMYSSSPTPSLTEEIGNLMQQGYSLLSCAYGNLTERRTIHVAGGTAFWNKKRPAQLSGELIARIEQAGFPLVDLEVERCPERLAQAVALAKGKSGALAQAAQMQAERAVSGAAEAEKTYCDRLRDSEATDKRKNSGEPTGSELCKAVLASMISNTDSQNNAPGTIKKMFPGAMGEFGSKFAELRNQIAGKSTPEITSFSKTSCTPVKGGHNTYLCDYKIAVTVHFEGGALQRHPNGMKEIAIPGGSAKAHFSNVNSNWQFDYAVNSGGSQSARINDPNSQGNSGRSLGQMMDDHREDMKDNAARSGQWYGGESSQQLRRQGYGNN